MSRSSFAFSATIRFCGRSPWHPVPAGISLPIITFSFKPIKWSTLPLIVASVRTFVVSWNEAADKKESVSTEDLEIPNNTGLNVAGVLPLNNALRLIFVMLFNDN